MLNNFLEKKIHLDILAPDIHFLSERSEMVVIPTPSGDIGIRAFHEPFLFKIEIGLLQVFEKDKKINHSLYVGEGLARVHSDRILCLVEEVIPMGEITVHRLEEKIDYYKEIISNHDLTDKKKERMLGKITRMERVKIIREEYDKTNGFI